MSRSSVLLVIVAPASSSLQWVVSVLEDLLHKAILFHSLSSFTCNNSLFIVTIIIDRPVILLPLSIHLPSPKLLLFPIHVSQDTFSSLYKLHYQLLICDCRGEADSGLVQLNLLLGTHFHCLPGFDKLTENPNKQMKPHKNQPANQETNNQQREQEKEEKVKSNS